MLKPLREFACGVAQALGFTEQQVNEIEICVDEACTNAIEHAYVKTFERDFANNEKDIYIEMTFMGNGLTVRVIDHGCGAEGGTHPRIRSLEEYIERDQFRGLGFYLMHKYMDRVTVHTSPGRGTTIEMTKFRK